MKVQRSIYIHIPFCRQRCHYCDFLSFSGSEKRIPAYFEALHREIRAAARYDAGESLIQSIYFGGGTPSLAAPDDYALLLQEISCGFQVASDAEITLEANPGGIQGDGIAKYGVAGINRISLGVQSFQEDELKFLGRIHTADQARACIDDGQVAGVDNLSLDLIFGLPGQTLEQWAADLTQALERSPQHLSLYNLTIEEGTRLAVQVEQGNVDLLPDDQAAQMYEYAIDYLSESGYSHYEVSNWCRKDPKKDFRSRHNLHYWRNGEYYGIGLGAHGYLRGLRVANLGNLAEYIHNSSSLDPAKYPLYPGVVVSQYERMQDEMMLGLRMLEEGVPRERFRRKFGRGILDVFSKEVSYLMDHNLVHWVGEEDPTLVLTGRGVLLGNQAFMQFVG